MKKFLTIIGILCLGLSSALAQTIQVSGTVTSAEDGSTLPGVTVVIKGTSIGTVTESNGKYSFSVPQDATLVFSFVGMASQEIVVGNRQIINVEMQASAQEIDEVVVVAYGTAKKGTYTGSVAVANSSKTLKDIPVTSFENALQGAASGVQVGMPNGQPGSQVQIRIRGTGSIKASNEPLYVIDGVPANSGEYSLSTFYGGSMGMMSTINPSDIENVTILKDAAATALYGSRGANGVILVTTKKGKQGDIKINFKGSWGFNDFAMDNRPILNGYEARELTLEGAYNQGIYNGMSDADAREFATEEADYYSPVGDNDWISALFRDKGQNSMYEISVSGGNEHTTFYVSGGYRKELGMANNTDLDGYTAKASIIHKAKKWTVTAESSIASMKQHIMYTGTSYTNFYYDTRNWLRPNVPIYNNDGSFYNGYLLSDYKLPNPAKDKDLDDSSNELFKSLTTGSIAYEFIEGLRLKETLSFDYNDILGTNIWPSNSNNGDTHKGLTQQERYVQTKLYSSLLLTYDKTLFQDHTIGALLGWDVDDTRSKDLFAAARGFASPDLWEMTSAAEPLDATSNHDDDRVTSYFGRLNYSYKSKYYASLTFRRDGSSRLGVDTRWGNFWSVSGSWRIKEEDFMNNFTQIDDLKLRASYGVSGTLPNSLYGSLSTYEYTQAYNSLPASRPSRIANSNLGWEKNYVLDIGVEARLFDRVNFEFDYYDRVTKDLLLDVPLSLTTGFRKTLMNYGEMNNRGVELTLGVDILKGDLKWNTTFLLSHNRNRITKLNENDIVDPDNGGLWLKEGEPRYSYRAREWAGVDPGTGESMWYKYTYDENGGVADKSITKDPATATRLVVGHADPKVLGGWRNTFYWNGIDFDFLFTYSFGGHSWDNGWTTTSDGFYPDRAISRQQLDRWQKPGDQAIFPKRMHGGGHGNYTSSRWFHSTDHIRLKSLTLGYTVPQKWTKKVSVQNARVFVAGNNLLTWAAYDDYDPEVGVSGLVEWNLPTLRSVVFGVEIGF